MRPLIKQLYFSLMGALALSLLFGCHDGQPKLTRGEPPPAFTLAQLQYGSLSFPDDLRGKIVAIRFWADWCPFCKTEMLDIEPVYRKYRAQDLVILAVNVRQERKKAAAFIRGLDISYAVLLDPEGTVAKNYGVLGLPTTIIIDREGKLHTKILGESTPELFEKIIQELL